MDDNNTRVTNAVLGNEMVHVKESLNRLDGTISDAVGEMKNQARRSTEVEKCIAVLKTDFDNLDEKVDNMDDRYKKINIATAAGAAIGTGFATVLAILGIKQ